MSEQTMRNKADALLVEWYLWSRRYRMRLDYPSVSPNFANVVSSRQWDEASEVSTASLRDKTMTDVDFVIDQLKVSYRIAIGLEMHWRNGGTRRKSAAVSYTEALFELMPKLIRAGFLG